MKRVLVYNSENVLPPEIEIAFKKAHGSIQDNRFEPDKIYLDLENLRSTILFWMSEHIMRND